MSDEKKVMEKHLERVSDAIFELAEALGTFKSGDKFVTGMESIRKMVNEDIDQSIKDAKGDS